MQCGGRASDKMAKCDVGVLFGGVEWSSAPVVTFHRNKGKNLELTESNTVATRTEGSGFAIVFTSEPMVAGQMLKVRMTKMDKHWAGGMVRDDLVCAILGYLSQ